MPAVPEPDLFSTPVPRPIAEPAGRFNGSYTPRLGVGVVHGSPARIRATMLPANAAQNAAQTPGAGILPLGIALAAPVYGAR